jgi:hypothetical protein
MEVYVDKHHIRLRHLYVMPLASTFLDEESMEGCIRKAVEWCEGLPSHDATYVKKMELTETIGVLVFIQHLNHYFVDRVLITNNHTLNILPYHKNLLV